MAFFRQLRLLMWKNFLLQRKKICVTVFEIVLPLLFGVIFFSMRFLVDIRHEPAQSYYTRDVARRVSYYWYGDVTVLFTPNNTLINGLITDINGTLHNHTSTYAYSSLPTFRGFSSRKDMLDYYSYNSKQVGFAVEFDNVAMTDTVLPKTLRCAIRPKGDRYGGWHTTESTPFVASSVPRSLYGPDYQDFLGVQRLLHEAIIKHFNPNSTPILNELEVQMLRMPYPPYIVDTMNALLRYMFPVLLMLSFILMAIQTTKGVVYEKERKLKESMKLMGLSASAHWTSLFLTSFIYVLVIMALYALLCGVNASGKGAALAKSDPSLFFVFLLCYGVSIISYCFMISVFTQRANIGAAISGIVFFISYCPYFYLQITYQTMSRPAKLASCLLFNVGMAFGANVISLYEGAGSGVQWSNFHEPATVDDNFSLLDAILMLLGDTAIHLLITWYMDNVWPGEFGVPKPFHFPFTASYWCGTKQRNADYSSNQHLDEKHFEKEPSGMKTGISILNLKKVFGSGSKKKVAVDGMSLNMFEGQISVLLGHNGAGKTTTMSVLTGFIPSSGGTAIVNGYDINNDIQSVRQSLGLCPQHNILFDSLTVQEHLEFFACLKGCPSNAVQSEVITMINEVGLSQKRFTQSQHLSGGQKRKLSVGIALIGGSKIVILDEPTSGMDPAARRQTWDILQRNRQGRTMLLTTHFMDEADLLGDRIAIMTEGVVKCCGTSYFLKKLYGAGYHLVMVKEPTCQVPSVTAVVQRYVPTAVMESEINAELSYLLPDDQSVNFAALFTEIEIHRGKLGISSFGASATTMEEVFLKAGEEEQKEDGDVNEDYPTGSRNNLISNGTNGWTNGNYEMREAGTADILAFNRGFTKTRGIMLELSRFIGMFVKKALHTWRNRTITIVQLLLPVLFAIAALAISKVDPGEVVEVPLPLDLAPFKGTYVPYFYDPNQRGREQLPQQFAQAYRDQFAGTENIPVMINLSTYDVTSYFLSRAKELGIGGYNKKVIIGAQFKSSKEAIGIFNGQPYHGQPIALSFMMNAILKHFTSQDHSITTINNPLPLDDKETSDEIEGLALTLGFSIAFCLLFGMAFLTSSFVYFLIKERQVGAKHLQIVSGVGPFVFWLSNLAWDYINYLIPSLLLLVVFAGFQSPAYTEDGRLGIVFLVLLVYGLAVLPFMYALQNMFKSPPTGVVVIIILNIITGLATLLSVFMMTTLDKKPEANIADWVFLVIFPHYNFGKSYMDMYSNYLYLDGCIKQNYTSLCATPRRNGCCKDSCGDSCYPFTENFLDWDSPGVGRYVVFMLFQGIMYMSVTLFIEYQIPQRIWYAFRPQETEVPQPGAPSFSPMQQVPEDGDVLRERQRIDEFAIGAGNSDALVLKDVYKRYGNFVAVDHLSVGIPEKECFGLLGQNGAGKTTTFKMITGDVMLTHGNVFLRSFNIKNHTQKVQENMGYCPQFDALIDQMTGRETLTMYARLKGVPESCIKGVCDNLLDIMMLRQYSDKATSEYSGGNKRKLSTAIALVGDPAFIMLDEPSTGMDPKARRQLWNVLSKVRECGRTLVLTSHSMEECDALCTRIAIMVNGRFMCLGTPQHLKTKFGQGYTLIARMKTVETQPGVSDERAPAPTEPLVNFITSSYPNTHVFDDHQGYVHFQVPYNAVSLAQVFTLMEQSKVQFSVEDYSVHQTTLEQVFLSFTRWQIPPKEDKTSLCKRICCCC
ncbi:phospholipid-transporting ATPase ABCA3-like isoform X2 [Haliotis rufescens]|uniref:phospholipid-transporting ATPase ABCA3-like isoform X2 n=1 Tax=Haliotis rufescens TaxID=6454 RepID=UPI00201E7819|nr:phospholipid-transporting ATPase ABCA3-like isoform X2 [Haliotis rufescens]